MSKRTILLLAIGAIAALVVGWQVVAFAGPVGNNSGFEDDDGNLVVNSTFDWNGFTRTWTGTAPTRTATGSGNGWTFKGIEDWAATTADSGFAGGTKQDQDCASVISAKAPNKDDLKRVYLSSKLITVAGDPNPHVFLNLAWVRIPQNTTSASAHIGFEFNKNSSGSCNAPGGLVKRTVGDMLIVYDFEGSSTDNPTLTLRRWVTSGACEISSNSPPCWGTATNLTAGGFAEGKVNTTATAQDTVAPSTETLGLNEYGEAGIDLSAAGVFSGSTCESFGKAYAVSRSSGNSGTAQMKDLAGPTDFTLQNCGTIKIIKHTDPRGVNQAFGYTTTGGLSPSTFTLNDNGNTTGDSSGNTRTYSNVKAGSYSVTEDADPTGFAFDSLSCTDSSGNSTTTSGRTANITVAGGGTTTCTYVNKQNLGAIKVTKTYKHAASGSGDQPQSGVDFTVNGVTKATNASGEACFDGLSQGSYTVHETVPAGYHVDANDKQVTVDNSASCSAATYAGETVSFHNTPLTDVTVSVNSQVDGGTASTIDCGGGDTASTDANGDGELTLSDLEPNDPDGLTCTIVIDP